MPKYKDGTAENLHRINRFLSTKFDRTLSPSDTIIFLSLYYAKSENLDIELNNGIWQTSDINGKEDTNEIDKSNS